MKSDTGQTMKLKQLCKAGSECELNGCLIAKSVRVSEQNSVRLTFYKYIYNIVITFYHDISDFLRNFF